MPRKIVERGKSFSRNLIHMLIHMSTFGYIPNYGKHFKHFKSTPPSRGTVPGNPFPSCTLA